MTKRFLGEALPKRPDQSTNKLTDNGGFVSNLDNVSVDVRTISSGGTYTTPTFQGTEFDRMRRYGLVLSRWALPDTARRSKRSGMALTAYTAASRMVANHMFRQVFDDEDPSRNTVNVLPYVNAIKSGNVTPELMHAVLALEGTGSFDQILKQLNDSVIARLVRDSLQEYQKDLREFYVGSKSHNFRRLNGLHSDRPSERRVAYRVYESIVNFIYNAANRTSGQVEAEKRSAAKRKVKQHTQAPKKQQSGTKENGIPHKTIVQLSEVSSGWQKPFLAKYPLDMPHTGKLGRREIPTNEGKYPKAFYRLVTDPYRRIFKRKTRALGGVVVFDCSGSMGLSEDDIRKVLKASAGCSIICYSASGSETRDAINGNIHLIAKNGRQCRYLPEFPGGNGVDLPALRYGYDHLRQNSKSPVIWVSDGQVTGNDDMSSEHLRRVTRQYTQKHNIIRVDDVDEAINLLAKLQKGIRS